MRRRNWILAATIAAFVVGWVAVQEREDRINKQSAYPVIRELGGRIGSLPLPFLLGGSELRIEFHNTNFRDDELKRLSVINSLSSRHLVGIMFKDTNVSRRDLDGLRTLLPECAIVRMVEGQIQGDR